MATRILTLNEDQAEAVVQALLIGLASYGEIEKVTNYAESMESIGKPVPRDAVPSHPTGTSDVTTQFADALRMVIGGMKDVES